MKSLRLFTLPLGCAISHSRFAFADDDSVSVLHQQPSFGATINLKKSKRKQKQATLDSMVLIGGTAYPQISQDISDLIKVPLASATMTRFSDGEVSIQFHDTLFEKDVYIIQPCAAPVNDSIMELLLTVSCVRRAGARRVIGLIQCIQSLN